MKFLFDRAKRWAKKRQLRKQKSTEYRDAEHIYHDEPDKKGNLGRKQKPL